MRAIALVLWLASIAHAARLPARVCRLACESVLDNCVVDTGWRFGRCRRKLAALAIKCRRHGVAVCTDAYPPPTTTTTTTTLPPLSAYEHTFKFSGMQTADVCGVYGEPNPWFVTLNVDNGLGTYLQGDVYDADGFVAFAMATGTAAYPQWTMTTGLCSISTLGGRCGRVVSTLNGIPTSAGPVSGFVEWQWSDPDCTDRWDGSWELLY